MPKCTKCKDDVTGMPHTYRTRVDKDSAKLHCDPLCLTCDEIISKEIQRKKKLRCTYCGYTPQGCICNLDNYGN